MRGKVVVVTGAGGGVGKESARQLLALGATVVLVGRTESKLRAVTAEIGGGEVLAGDVGNIKDCRRIARELMSRFARLDVLIHNAASVPTTRTITAEGLEIAFAANCAGPYVLTMELFERMKASAPSRVIFIVGESQPYDIDDLNFAKEWNGFFAYQRSKFASLQVMHHLAKKFAGSGVTVNAAFPGIVNTPGMTDVITAAKPGMAFMLRLMRPFMRTPAKGAASTVFVASDPSLEKTTGTPFTIGKPMQMRVSGWDDDASAAKLVTKLDEIVAPL